MLASCVLNDYVSFYKVIFIIYLPLKSLQWRSDSEPPTTEAAVHVGTGLNMDKLNTFFALSFPRIYICKYLYRI